VAAGQFGPPPPLDESVATAYVFGVPPRILSASPTGTLLPDRFIRWFADRGWSPREHQLELLAKARDDRSALLIAPTGAGKTLAGFLPTLLELSAASPLARSAPLPPRSGGEGWGVGGGWTDPGKR
jgi:ATP-dependent Lhr-like helicase